MQRQQKLLLSCMVGGLMLLYGIAVAAALTPQEIHKIAEDSTVLLEIRHAKGNRMGSGFIVHDDQIATNYHVIENMLIGTAKLVGKENKYRVKVLTVDKVRDLAIVKAAGIDGPALPLGDSDAVQKGDTIYVAGNPEGWEGTVVPGSISGIRQFGDHFPLKLLQMTAPISKGSSGGAVLNDRGEVIGISTLTDSVLRPDLSVPQNLNFAVAVNHLKQLANIPITPPPAEPKQVTTEAPLPVESQPAKPQVDPPPVEPKPTLTPQEIAKTALGSTVHLGLRDAEGNSWTGSGFVVCTMVRLRLTITLSKMCQLE